MGVLKRDISKIFKRKKQLLSMLIDKEKIKKAKEKLGVEAADIIAEILHLEQYDQINHKALCCFHEEDTPSMVWNPKANSYKCFGCGRNTDILDAYMATGKSFAESVQLLFEKAGIKYSFGELGVHTKQSYYYPKPKYADNTDVAVSYWSKRGISKDVFAHLNMQQDKQGNTLFQYFDTNDVLTMVKVRPSRKVQHGETKVWCLKDEHGNPYGTSPILFNMNRINTDAPLLITCGEGDCAAAIQSGFTNAVSIPLGDQNTAWIDECYDWLEQFDEIIICPDNDESGNKFAKNVVPRLGSWRCKIAEVPEYFEKPDGTKVVVKDLNECLIRFGPEKVFDVIVNAKESPLASIVDFSDIEDIDMSSIDGIYTGINGIDKEIMRLFFGTLTILSGLAGAGKTSFLYQICGECLDQGYDAWVFSRELPSYMSKNWMNFILAGRRNLSQYSDQNGTVYYKVKPEAKKEISDYYRKRLFFYRDDQPNDVEAIKTSMVDSARKYGTKLFVLDNLTTINLGGDYNGQNTKQTEFVSWLIQFSMQYSVATILVCHPRKSIIGNDAVDMHDVAGSANIVNLAHRAIGLKRVTRREREGVRRKNGNGWEQPPIKFDVVLNVFKDRMRGRKGFEYGLYYDPASRRFFSNPEEFEHNYKWDKTKYSDHLPYPIHDDEEEVFGETLNNEGIS